MAQRRMEDDWLAADAADAEAKAERRCYLVNALARVRASSDLRIFVMAVARHAGVEGRWWQVTHAELVGQTPAPADRVDPLSDVMGCSRRQAERVTRRARDLGLVQAESEELAPGDGLRYQIDWARVKAIVGLGPPPPDRQEPDRHSGGPDRHSGGPDRHCGGPDRQPVGASDAPQRKTRAGAKTGTGTGPVRKEISKDRTGTGTGEPGINPRLLDGVTVETLGNTDELLWLLERLSLVAPVPGLGTSEEDQLWIVTAAECAMRTGRNPVGLFRFLLQRDRRQAPTIADQDAALDRLKAAAVRV